MDGTGVLSDPFLEAAPNGIDVVGMTLTQSADFDYADHARHLINEIGAEPILLVAESYSGMIAYEMLRLGRANIKHVVFAASFITIPSVAAVFARYLPSTLLKNRFIPRPLLGKLLFGGFSSDGLINRFYHALDSVEVNVLRQRLRQIACLQEPNDMITIPCTYIRPRSDKIVSPGVIRPFERLCKSLDVHEVDGTHFVLQTNPGACWRIIQRSIE